jgi:hypothetical protein
LILAGPLFAWLMLRGSAPKKDPCLENRAILWSGFIAIVPSVGKILLSNYEPYTDFHNHYAADMMPGLFFGVYGIYRILGLRDPHAWSQLTPQSFCVYITMAAFSSCLPLAKHVEQARETIDSFQFTRKIFPQDLRQILRQLPNSKTIFANTGYVYAELSQKNNFISTFTIDHVTQKLQTVPEILVLGWPPDHPREQFRTDLFDRSFRKIDESTLESAFQSKHLVYKLRHHFKAKLPGDIWIWELIKTGRETLP